jgi:peptide-methionine (R)-S-oxide reductase
MKPSFIALASTLLIVGCFAADPTSPKTKPAASMDSEKPAVVKSESEWKKKLTEEQYRVTREAGTERPFGLAYEEFDKQGEGTYYCVCCGAELFTSTQKFHSGCGWPSFYDQSTAKNIRELVDNSGGMHRIETVCKRCDAHLGHVFEGEGYKTPTDRRFCINGVALKFVPKGGKAPELEAIASEAVQKKKADVAKEGGVEVRK